MARVPDALGGDLALRFVVEQVQRGRTAPPGQVGQQAGDVGVEVIALGRISAQAADRPAVALQWKSSLERMPKAWAACCHASVLESSWKSLSTQESCCSARPADLSRAGWLGSLEMGESGR